MKHLKIFYNGLKDLCFSLLIIAAGLTIILIILLPAMLAIEVNVLYSFLYIVHFVVFCYFLGLINK